MIRLSYESLILMHSLTLFSFYIAIDFHRLSISLFSLSLVTCILKSSLKLYLSFYISLSPQFYFSFSWVSLAFCSSYIFLMTCYFSLSYYKLRSIIPSRESFYFFSIMAEKKLMMLIIWTNNLWMLSPRESNSVSMKSFFISFYYQTVPLTIT